MKRCLLFAGGCLGMLALFFGAIPPLFYRIYNAGGAGLLAGGGMLLALCLFWEAPAAWWRKGRGPLAGLIALGLCVVAVCSGLMLRFGLFNPPPAEEDCTVVVLGCKVEGDQPSRMLRYRLNAALSYLREHPASPVVVSGGLGEGKAYSEAEVMKRYLMAQGIDEARIYLEDASRNTEQNLRLSAAIISSQGLPAHIVVATDSFHQYRGWLYAARNGLTAYTQPSVTPWGLLPSYWVRECFAIARALLLP